MIRLLGKVFRKIALLSTIAGNGCRDIVRYIRWSRTLGIVNPARLRAEIVASYHVLEKGLGMPERKPVFGIDVASNLVAKLRLWERRHFPADHQIESAVAVLANYAKAIGEEEAASRVPDLLTYLETKRDVDTRLGGSEIMNKPTFLEYCKGDFAQLVRARRCIRNYSGEAVDESLIAEAVKLAQSSPSVCNRQCASVYWSNDREKIDAILELQNGNRGFGHLAGAVLIVTADLSVFEGAGERNEAYIDGGLFSMSLLYAFAWLGLGACPLNWCVGSRQDKRLRALVPIPQHHEVIMMMSVGHLTDDFSVAVSRRHPTTEIMCRIR